MRDGSKEMTYKKLLCSVYEDVLTCIKRTNYETQNNWRETDVFRDDRDRCDTHPYSNILIGSKGNKLDFLISKDGVTRNCFAQFMKMC